MKNLMIAAIAVLLMTGAAFAQDEGKKDVKMAHKEMKKEAKQMKKDAKQEADTKVDAAKDMKKMHKGMKKAAKKIDSR